MPRDGATVPTVTRGPACLKLDLYRRTDGALVVVPARFAHGLPALAPGGLRYVRSVDVDLVVLQDTLVLDIGLHGFAIAQGADEALLRSFPSEDAATV